MMLICWASPSSRPSLAPEIWPHHGRPSYIFVLIDGGSNLLSKGAFVSLVGEYIIQIIAEENNGEARPPSRKLENMHPRIRITQKIIHSSLK